MTANRSAPAARGRGANAVQYPDPDRRIILAAWMGTSTASVTGKRVVVTGGAGFIGSHLCEALLASDNRVTCVDNLVGTEGSTHNLYDFIDDPRFELVTDSVLDWADRTDLTGLDCIFHQAASKNTVALDDPELDLAVNGLGTLRLLLAAAPRLPKTVQTRPDAVGATGRAHRRRVQREVSLYGVSKLAGESYCAVIGRTFGLDYTVLR